MSALKSSVFSVYIPHVFPNFDKAYVSDVFRRYGEVSQVDFVAKQDKLGKDYNAVYVHFASLKGQSFKDQVEEDATRGGLQVLHDNPWYWIVLPNKAKKHVPGDRKPRIDLGDAKAMSSSNATSSGRALLDFITPVKKSNSKKCPDAPVKNYAQAVNKKVGLTADVSQSQLDFMRDIEAEAERLGVVAPITIGPNDYEDIEVEQMYAEMDEIEALMDEEDANLVSIDWRYVQAVEQENWTLRAEMQQLRAALINLDQMYQVETAKVRAFNCAPANWVPVDLLGHDIKE